MDKKVLIDYFMQFISDNRKQRFDEVMENRTRHLTVVMEDVFQSHNVSAVLRSCDCFGVQDVHVIENRNKYSVNPDVSLGSTNWLNVHRYNKEENNSISCIKELKAKGYKVIATTPHKDDCTIHELNLDQKTALVFGTEKEGITEDVIKHADGFVKIPMYGFTESFNISVSAALCLHTLVERLHASKINWHLTEAEKQDVLLDWLRASISSSKLIEKEFLAKQASS